MWRVVEDADAWVGCLVVPGFEDAHVCRGCDPSTPPTPSFENLRMTLSGVGVIRSTLREPQDGGQRPGDGRAAAGDGGLAPGGVASECATFPPANARSFGGPQEVINEDGGGLRSRLLRDLWLSHFECPSRAAE